MVVSIGGLKGSIPALETGALTLLFVLQGAGTNAGVGGGIGNIPQAINNIIMRLTGQSIPGVSSPNVTSQTIIGTSGWSFNGAMIAKIWPIVGAIVAKYLYKELVPSFPYKVKVTSYLVNPVLNATIAAGFINIILGDPAGNPATGQAVGSSVGRIATRIPSSYNRSVGMTSY
jgi:hypothetical protein